jgi:mRNA-degrading endonuclease RelE of RelBE toxin-antitoxin system
MISADAWFAAGRTWDALWATNPASTLPEWTGAAAVASFDVEDHTLLGADAIELLGDEPRPPAANKLTGRPEWRVRTGDYRVLYRIEYGVLTVVVVHAVHRREVYDRWSASVAPRDKHDRAHPLATHHNRR